MKTNFIEIEGDALKGNIYNISDHKATQKLPEYDWVEINTNNRAELIELLHLFSFNQKISEYILNPGKIHRLKKVDGVGIIDLHVGHIKDTLEMEFVTFLFANNKIITIADEGNEFFKRVKDEFFEVSIVYDVKIEYILISFFDIILGDNETMTKSLKRQIDIYSQNTIQRGETIEIEEIEQMKNDLTKLDDILENQYVAFGILPIYNLSSTREGIEKSIKNTVNGIEHLQRVQEKLDRKIDFIYQMYLYDLQELGNKKLNTLTIVQAIFVPLTFIAGIYGMNFLIMPELSWHYGYLYAILLMTLIVIIELYIFYKNGWFKSD